METKNVEVGHKEFQIAEFLREFKKQTKEIQKVKPHTDPNGQMVWSAYCREGCECLMNAPDGAMVEACGKIHVAKTGHCVIIGYTLSR